MTLYEFIDNFSEEDLFDEDMSELASIVNSHYYELAKEKLEGLKV